MFYANKLETTFKTFYDYCIQSISDLLRGDNMKFKRLAVIVLSIIMVGTAGCFPADIGNSSFDNSKKHHSDKKERLVYSSETTEIADEEALAEIWCYGYSNIISNIDSYVSVKGDFSYFELKDLDENGVPELIFYNVYAPKGFLGEIKVFHYIGQRLKVISIEGPDDGYYFLDEFVHCENKKTGEREWLFNYLTIKGNLDLDECSVDFYRADIDLPNNSIKLECIVSNGVNTYEPDRALTIDEEEIVARYSKYCKEIEDENNKQLSIEVNEHNQYMLYEYIEGQGFVLLGLNEFDTVYSFVSSWEKDNEKNHSGKLW